MYQNNQILPYNYHFNIDGETNFLKYLTHEKSISNIGFHFNTKYFIDTYIEINNLFFYKYILFFMAYQLNKGEEK